MVSYCECGDEPSCSYATDLEPYRVSKIKIKYNILDCNF
jgi:hypothetical protein